MKNLFLLLLITLAAFGVNATPVIKAKTNNGRWSTSSDWNLNRLPKDNDTIIIPANMTFIVDEHAFLTNVVIRVYGTIKFAGGKLDLCDASKVFVENGGIITGNGNNERVRIGNTTKFQGKDADITGYSFADNTTGSGFILVPGILPVRFTSFKINRSNSGIVVNWSTVQEINNSHFEIERSKDGRTWNKIATVEAAKTATLEHQYTYTDKIEIYTVTYYRILQVDLDGAKTYTEVSMIRSGESEQDTHIYASANMVSIELKQASKESMMIRVISLNGMVLNEKLVQQPGTLMNIRLNDSIKGLVIVQVMSKSGLMSVKKILI